MKTQNLDDLEKRVMAAGGADKLGFDFHKARAAEIFNIPIDQVTPEQRVVGKRRNFFRMYLA